MITNSTARSLRALASFALVLAFAQLARAAFAPTILLVSAPNVPAGCRADARAALSSVAEVSDARGYLASAAERGLDPLSDEALTTLAPGQYATLLVVLERDGDSLRISLRDGRNGAGLRSGALQIVRQHIDEAGRGELAGVAREAIGELQGGGGAGAPPSAAESDAGEAASEPPGADETGDAGEAVAAGETRSVEAHAVAGFGIATRAVSLPTAVGLRDLSTGLFPALELGLGATAKLSAHFELGARIAYQTSVGLSSTEVPPGRIVRSTSLRSHHVELGIVPTFRFSSAEHAVSLGAFLGWTARGLRSVADIDLPAYTMHGPVLRLELDVPLGDGSVSFRVAPELIAFVSLSHDLRSAGNLSGAALGLGGEASLRVRCASWLSLAASYRESHASANTAWADTFRDIERFITLQGVLQY